MVYGLYAVDWIASGPVRRRRSLIDCETAVQPPLQAGTIPALRPWSCSLVIVKVDSQARMCSDLPTLQLSVSQLAMDTYCSPFARERHHERSRTNQPAFRWTGSRFMKIFLAVCTLPVFLNALSGDWRWPQAWFVSLTQILILSAAARHIWLDNPSLFTEREKFTGHEDTAPFDKVLATAVVSVTPFLYLAAGLEHRYTTPWDSSWSTVQITAAAVDILSLLLQGWAMASNHWFSSVVRIQTDRGHRVCHTGPYSYVRHPGYTGAVLQPICEAVMLKSSWCMVAAIVRTVILATRTVLEDALLQQKLTGYADYAHKVRYKLAPWVW